MFLDDIDRRNFNSSSSSIGHVWYVGLNNTLKEWWCCIDNGVPKILQANIELGTDLFVIVDLCLGKHLHDLGNEGNIGMDELGLHLEAVEGEEIPVLHGHDLTLLLQETKEK